jgi:ABC-type phosphate/phosphonate transport system substrate-binding protein
MKRILALLPILAALQPGLDGARAADYVVSVEPSYPPEQIQEVYKPLAEYLKAATGHNFRIVAVRNYHFYWRDLRQNVKTDFSFAEAHFTEYRMRRYGHVPLARKNEATAYSLLADPEHAERGVDGLVGRRVVTMPSPSLGFALLAELFKNPVSQPEFRSEASSWRDGVEMVFSGDAEAAMVPDYIAQQYPNLVELARSREFLGTTMSASPEVPENVRSVVRDALLRMHEDESAFNVLVEIGASGFEPANPADYRGAEEALRGFFGYQPQ